MTDAERIARYNKLDLSEAEKQELLSYDKAVEATKEKLLDFDLSPEKEKISQSFCRTGTRKQPTTYKFSPRKRKSNATKAGIVEELKSFLEENSVFSVENIEITNKERQIAFRIGEDSFELTLVQKRKSKK